MIKINISKKISLGKKGFKYFVSFKDDEKFIPFMFNVSKNG